MAVVVTTEPRGFNVYQSNLDKRSLRSALLLGAASVAAIGFAAPASAQESTETVVVTGSRIPQQGLYASSPVTAVGQQELKFEGTTNVENLLNNLPGVFADYGQSASNGASGTATVNLRNLGSARTLVLVDGRRLMPGDPSLPVADLNNIPAALVDHVEVLTGGASAVYGSDALGGVVNFIMRKDFEGVEIDGQWGIAQHNNDDGNLRGLQDAAAYAKAPENVWDGRTLDGTLIVGANSPDGKGNITAYVSYRNSQPVLGSQRDVSACSLDLAATNFRCAGSSNKNRWLSFDRLVFLGGGYDFYQTGTGAPGSGAFQSYGGTPASVRSYNYGAVNYFQRPDERYTAGFSGHYEVSPMLDVYTDFMFADDHTVAQIAESGAFLGGGPTFFPGTISPGYLQVNCDNPFMTPQENTLLCGPSLGGAFVADARYTGGGYFDGAGNITPGQSLVWIGRRDFEGGKRQDDLRHTSYRMVVGAKGDLGGGWAYDVYAQYGLTLYTENYKNEWSKARVQNSLQVTFADPITTTPTCTVVQLQIDPNCVPLDIFNGIGSVNNTPGLGYVIAQGFKSGWTQEQVLSGSVTGDLGAWGIQSPGAKSPVSLAIGAEYRSEAILLDTSRDFQTGDLYGQGAKTLPVPKSQFSVVEGFGEVRIPIIQGVPFVEDLTLNGGYRYSSYSSVGATRSWKYGAEWQIVDDVKLRGGIQRAVRAPNVLESFAPAVVQLFGGSDPCSDGFSGFGGITTGQCATVPNAGTALLNCPAGQCNYETSGNANLKPETSDTKTFGIVFTPTFFDGFTATVDYFDIKVADYISLINPNNTLEGCYGSIDGLGNTILPSAAQVAFFCPFVQRSANGTIFGAGFVEAHGINLGYLRTKGWDMEANYSADLADWGMGDNGGLAFNFVGTLLRDLDTKETPFKDADLCAGMYGPVCGTPVPKWRHKLRVTWSSPWDFDLSASWRHIGGVTLDTPGAPDNLGGKIEAWDYLDLAGNWSISEGVEIRAGVNNVLDKDPPVLSSGTGLPMSSPPFGNGNTFPQVYDALGRTIFIGGTIKY